MLNNLEITIYGKENLIIIILVNEIKKHINALSQQSFDFYIIRVHKKTNINFGQTL